MKMEIYFYTVHKGRVTVFRTQTISEGTDVHDSCTLKTKQDSLSRELMLPASFVYFYFLFLTISCKFLN